MAVTHLQPLQTIAITGARGFMGTHLRSLLEKEGIPYQTFDGDVLDDKYLESFFQNNAVKTVIHLAGTFEGNFETLLQKNVLTTQKLLAVAIKYGLKRVIYTSTGAVYGEPVNEESKEDDPLRPNTLYGLSKKFAEECITYYHQNQGVEYVILRYPNVYGEGNNKGVLYNFLKAITEKREISIAGTGTQSRHFLHVTDACNAIVAALHYERSGVFNISNPVRLSINDVVREFQKHYQFTITHKPQDNYLKDLLLNIDKAKRLLNFEITVPDISAYISNGSKVNS